MFVGKEPLALVGGRHRYHLARPGVDSESHPDIGREVPYLRAASSRTKCEPPVEHRCLINGEELDHPEQIEQTDRFIEQVWYRPMIKSRQDSYDLSYLLSPQPAWVSDLEVTFSPCYGIIR